MSGPAPRLAADAIVVHPARGVLLVKRCNPPPGWALPGGFVEYGETVEAAVAREVAGETGLMLGERSQFRVVSHPERDPRGHRVSVVFTASLTSSRGEPRGGGDARQARQFSWDALPELAFDHARILEDYRNSRA